MPTPRGARSARRITEERLSEWGLPLDPARQIVAELAANAATHGRISGRCFRLTLYVVKDTLRMEVTDTQGHLMPHLAPPEDDSESGRGLLIVEALADRWGASVGARPRKTVWAELKVDLPEPGSPCFGCTGDYLLKATREKDPTKPHPSSRPQEPRHP
ncbi:ATP-binding protein [Streptomyces sp. NPDC048290]|uniref:ATP-binding protein n=1 Tax=Streptomyces sp. NPDC048290 TaxID=3155811 RepID=UPI00344996F0